MSSSLPQTRHSAPPALEDGASGRLSKWLHNYGRSTFLAWDFILGFLVFGLVCILAGTQESVRDGAVPILIAESALGAGLLAVVLGALAILVTFLDDHYRQVLELTPTGVRGAMVPYQSVAFVGALTVITGLGTALAWPALPSWAQTILLGLVSWFLTWAAVGTVQLVGITTFNGIQRARLLEAIHDARALSERRKRSA